MNKQETEELIEVIDSINEGKAFAQVDASIFYIEYRYTTYQDAIYFMDQCIWDSENDDREFYELENCKDKVIAL